MRPPLLGGLIVHATMGWIGLVVYILAVGVVRAAVA